MICFVRSFFASERTIKKRTNHFGSYVKTKSCSVTCHEPGFYLICWVDFPLSHFPYLPPPPPPKWHHYIASLSVKDTTALGECKKTWGMGINRCQAWEFFWEITVNSWQAKWKHDYGKVSFKVSKACRRHLKTWKASTCLWHIVSKNFSFKAR